MIIGGVLVFFFLILFIGWLIEKNRQNAMQELANSLGFSFLPRDVHLENQYNFFKVFHTGHSHQIMNVMTGSVAGATLTICDYMYVTGRKKNKSTHSQTLFIVSDPAISVPNALLRRESPIFDGLGKLFGGQDVNFSEDAKFSSAFVLQGMKEPDVRRLFDRDLREFFVRYSSLRICFEAWGDAFLFHFSRRLPTGDVRRHVDTAADLVRLLHGRPEFCVNPSSAG